MFRLNVDKSKGSYYEEKTKPFNTETQRLRGKTKRKSSGILLFSVLERQLRICFNSKHRLLKCGLNARQRFRRFCFKTHYDDWRGVG